MQPSIEPKSSQLKPKATHSICINNINQVQHLHWTFSDAPTCAPNQQRVYGVAKQEQAQIKCIVDANPSDVEFKWTFNNSAESIDVASNHVTRSGECSFVLFVS